MNKCFSTFSAFFYFITCFTISAQNISAEIPNAPTSLTAVAVSLNQINLVWHDNATDETNYEIQILSGSSWISLGSVAANTNTFYHKNLTPGSSFSYRVFAKNSSGNSDYSNEAMGFTPPSIGTRYETKCFTSNLTSNIQYGSASRSLLDLYEPSGDLNKKRPLVIFIHGGGFSAGDKVGTWNTILCTNLAQRGYVVASINYRLTTTQNTLAQRYQAMVRALQDAKAVVRFFRKNAATYKIDTSQIFATGSSAGSITSIHLAYLQQNEVPVDYISDWSLFDGSLEGNSGNPNFSSKIHGVINNWGAIGELDYIKPGDVPIFCVHGTSDATISFDSTPAYWAMNYGSKPIVEHALDLDIHAGLLPFPNVGHTLNSNTTYFNQAADAIGNWLCTVLKIYTEGNSSTSISTLSSTADKKIINIFPNPLNQEVLTIKIDTKESLGDVELLFTNIQGQVVYHNNINNNNNTYKINISSLKRNSIYFVTVRSKRLITNTKLIVQ